jgi:ribose transport system permease protein
MIRSIRGAIVRRDETGIFLALLLLCLGLAFAAPEFRDPDNLLTVARQFSVVGIMAVGMTFVIVAGEIDLSVGSILALAGCLAAKLVVERDWPVAGALAAAVVTGTAAGAVNGWLTVRLAIPSFIITLGMMSVIRGLTFVLTRPCRSRGSGSRSRGWGTAPWPACPCRS